MIRTVRSLSLFAFFWASSVAWCQTADLQGRVFDESGAVVPKATITLTNAGGQSVTTTSSDDGSYSFTRLPPGEYTVRGTASGLAQEPISIVLKKGMQTLRLELKV